VRTLVRKRELDLQRLDANKLTMEVAQLLEDESRRRRIALLAELATPPVQVMGDRALLGQVLINLVRNAMDAVEAAVPDEDTFRPPVILRTVATAHNEIEGRVIDAGVGIPDDKLDRLFDSFYTSKPHGMGLGLSIARSIVVAHGGRIRAGNNPGGGATFGVILRPPEAAESTAEPSVRRPP
jgi:signal transduction histidine kinase